MQIETHFLSVVSLSLSLCVCMIYVYTYTYEHPLIEPVLNSNTLSKVSDQLKAAM